MLWCIARLILTCVLLSNIFMSNFQVGVLPMLEYVK